MPDLLTHGRLFTVEVDGHGWMLARSPQSGIELARVQVDGDSTAEHIEAAMQLVTAAFDNLRAQGYPRAYDDEDVSMSEPDRELYERAVGGHE